MTTTKTDKQPNNTTNDCFIVMPISDPDGYDKGHFSRVYEDIFKPACEKSGYTPVRADDVKQTNLIHLDILQKLLDSPMVVCDLSSRNPNVLFELGLRQAFDKPTVLVQEKGTPKIFDIAPLRVTEYRRELKYREVIEDQDHLASAIQATKKATSTSDGTNSIVSILSLSRPASLKQVEQSESSGLLQIVRAEISELRSEFRRAMTIGNSPELVKALRADPATRVVNYMHRITSAKKHLAEATRLSEVQAPRQLIADVIEKAMAILSQTMEADIPLNSQTEILGLLAESDALLKGINTSEDTSPS